MKLYSATICTLILGLLSATNLYAQSNESPTLGSIAENVRKEMDELSSFIEEYIEVSVKCLQENDKDKIDSCTVSAFNQLSDKGNYIAQHALGNYYERIGDKTKAIEYYQLALKNSKLSEEYKPEIEKDLERAKK